MTDNLDILTQWTSEGITLVDEYLELTSRFLLDEPSGRTHLK
jgi:hypothetical protein